MAKKRQSVVAVVVTYRREMLLEKCLRALLSHSLNHIIVVNNGGSDDSQTIGLVENLSQETNTSMILLNTPKNLGGAGGFALGIRRALETECEYLWLMDDDCEPGEQSLANLLATADRSPTDSRGRACGFFASAVYWSDGSKHKMNIPKLSENWFTPNGSRGNSLEIERCSFVSALIPKKVAEFVGLPVSEFFIWGDDVEYTLRISKHYGYGRYVLNSQVHHHTATNTKVDFGQVANSDLWKFRHGFINSHALLLGHREYARFFFSYVKTLFIVLSGKSSMLTKLQLIMSSAYIPSQARIVSRYLRELAEHEK